MSADTRPLDVVAKRLRRLAELSPDTKSAGDILYFLAQHEALVAEVERLRERVQNFERHVEREIEPRLVAEVERLREALERIAYPNNYPEFRDGGLPFAAWAGSVAAGALTALAPQPEGAQE